MSFEGLAWPDSQLEEATTALLARAGLAGSRTDQSRPKQPNATPEERIASQMGDGVEVVLIQTTTSKLRNELPPLCPLILRLPDGSFLAARAAKGREFQVIVPGLNYARVSIEDVCQALQEPVEKARRQEYRELFLTAGLSENKSSQAAAALLDEEFGRTPYGCAWSLREAIGQVSLAGFLRLSGVYRRSALLVLAHVFEYLLWLAAWTVMGQVAFSGQMDRGWLSGWGLLLLTTVPFRIATIWLQGALAISAGSNLKRRLLEGALRLDRDTVRQQGSGSFLGQALEAEAVESLTLSGGILGLLALVELLIAGFVLGMLATLLFVWCVLTGLIIWRFYARFYRWTDSRMDMTGELVENMAGHRTRVAQMPAEHLHRGEDATLADYVTRSQQVDEAGMWLVAAVPRSWLIAGLLWLVPLAMSGASAGPALAIKLGGVLLAFTAFQKVTASAVEMIAATVASRRIVPLFRAAAQGESRSGVAAENDRAKESKRILEADRLTFRYRAAGAPALQPSSLSIGRGDKILLEGASGGGKTTLASLLSGMRKPASGLLLLHGLDVHTIGAQRWRQRIAAAPQFHENYILTETLAFNLLLGRGGARTARDLEEAEIVCRELGLGDLLDRMPGGIEQMVGEGGWQLSHGERSRIYAARALLQIADLVILDECFGALDPENLKKALTSSVALAETLVVIAHP